MQAPWFLQLSKARNLQFSLLGISTPFPSNQSSSSTERQNFVLLRLSSSLAGEVNLVGEAALGLRPLTSARI